MMLLVSQQVRHVRSGVGTYARVLLEALVERGHRPTVATWSGEIDPGLPVDWLDLGRPPRLDPTPGAFWTLGRRVQAARSGGFPLVHFLDAREAHAWRKPVRRLVGTVHDDYAAHAPRAPWGLFRRAADPVRRWAYYAWLRRLERRTYRRFDLLHANAGATAHSVVEHYGVAPERVAVVPLCVAPAQGSGRVALEGAPALLFAGGNFFRKGLDVLVRALALVRTRRPGAVLHVVGRDGAQGRIEKIVCDLDLMGAVRFHGRVPPDTLAAMMAGATAFCMPSRREALGLVYLEAARAGAPVVAGDRGGVTDVVRHRESGLLVPVEDAPALADAILALADDEALRGRLVAGARRELAARTSERLARATLDGYGLVEAS